ncbi:E3 SUMO-protein ligase RanBP2 [Holothuria leucospilota]|uniref:Nuclear pore complex protein Nup153 n=1 Tax=Holothuria leucospilota TaxID=206669 RepID=A0A9Q1BPF6_HOLLE|nr:E3 SUMO-protein ligase RanBP2 [Holothuria leucospilota]
MSSSQRSEAQGYALALNCLKKKEFSKGIHHALQYAGFRPRDVRIHELLGELYEGEREWKKAIESYKVALQADPQKSKLGLKVVDLYCRIPDELERLKHWTNQVGKKYPDEPVIHRAWEIIYKSSNQLGKFADYIKRKMQNDPDNRLFNIKLLECLQSQKIWMEALDQCDRILDVLHWSEEALQCVVSFNEKLLLGGSYVQLTSDIIVRSSVNLLVALCYLTQVQLANSGRTLNYCTDMLDRLGKKAIELEPKLKNLDGVFKYPCQSLYLSEIRGQFHYLMGTFLLHLGLAGSLPLTDAMDMTTALYAMSLQEEAKRRNNLINMGWTPVHSRIVARLSCNRVGQIWHFLHNITTSRGDEYLQQTQRKWCSTEGHKTILNQAFGTGQDLHFLRTPSFLFTSEPCQLNQTELDQLLTSVFETNCESVASDPENFQLLIWTCLQWDTRQDNIPSDFGHFVEETFGNLAFSTNKLKIMSIDNLRVLDLEAFLYAVVIVVRATLAAQQAQVGGSLDLAKKNLPILTLRHKLGTQEQEEWFQSVFRLCHSKVAARDQAKLRVRAQKGLEVLRCGASHGTETQLLVQLGRTMNERMIELRNADGPGDRCRAYQAMSALYWTEALNHLKRLANDGAVPKLPRTFFPHVHKEFHKSVLKQYIDEGSVVLAEFYAQNGDVPKALKFLEEVTSPEGLFVKAHMYKQLSDEQTASDLEYQLTPTRLTIKGELLDKAKHSLYTTMDGISESANHPLHEKVKNLLVEIEEEQETLARKAADIDGSPLPAANESSIYHSLTGNTSYMEQTSNDPSPQRLASEIRSLNLSHIHMEREREETKKMLELQNKTLDQNQTMMEQQSRLVEHILNLKAQTTGMTPQSYGDSEVLRKISQQSEKLYDVMNSMKNDFQELKQRDVGDLKEKMAKLELEQERGKVRELEKQVAAAGKSSQTPPSVASPAPPSMMPGPSMMTGHKPLYQQQMVHPSAITYVPHPHYPGYVVPVESTYHAGMMTSTPAVRRSGTPQTALPGFATLYDNGSSPTEEDEELKQQFGKGGLSLQPGDSREYVEPGAPSLLPSSQFTQIGKVATAGTPMRSMGGSSQSWQSPSGASILSGVVHQPTSSQKTLGLQGQRLDGSPSLAAYTAAAGQRPQQPSVMGNQPGSNLLTVPRPIVTSVSTAKPSSHLIKSPTPASQSLASHLASTKPTATTQSPFAGFSFNKAPGTSSSFASSQTFQIPKSTAPVTTTSASSPFAGFSFQTTPSKKDTPALFGSNTSSQSSKDSSAAQQYPQLTALLVGGPNEEEEGTAESPRPGFYAPSQSSETSQRKPGQSPMGVTSSVSQKKEDKPNTTTLKGKDDNYDDDDVIFMGEVKATPEQVAKAEKLMLPPNFYLYEQRPPCPGCRGCDEEDLKAKKDGNKPIVVEQKSSSLFPEKPKVSEAASQPPSFFGNAAISSLSFASLSADGDASFAKKDTSTKPFQFAGAGAPVFGSTQQDDDNVAEDQEYDPHYDPIISLPENVDLTTGDEGQEVVFKERAKLYRYDSDTQAWKERGVGDMKILVNPETGKARILMRREQVLKVCANHWLKADMQLLPMSSSDRAFVWNAIDFAEGEECHQQFALKFKTPELAAEFKKTFDEMKKGVKPSLTKPVEEAKPAASKGEDDSGHRFHQADPVVTHPEEEETEDDDKYDGEYEGEEDGYEDEEDYYEDDDDEYEDYDDEEEDEEYVEGGYPEEPSLADQFKPTAGSWDCDTCMVNNPADKNQCLACSTAKPGATSQPSKGSSETQPSLSEMFKPASGSWVCNSCMISNPADKVQCIACSTPKPGSSQPLQGSSGDSQGTPGGMGMVGGAFSLGNFKFSGFSSNPSAFSAGSGSGSSGFNKSTPGTFSFGQTPSQSSNTTPSSSAGFSFPPGGFSVTQFKPETSQPSDSGGFKIPAASSFAFTAPTLPSSESTKSAADSTTKEQPLSKQTEAASGQQTITPKFSFGSGMPQFTFGGTGQQKPSSGFSFGSTPGSSALTSQAAGAPSSSTTSQPGSGFGGTQSTAIFGATPEKGSTSAFKGFEFSTKQSEPKTEQKEAISFSDLVKNQGEFSFRLNVDNVASSPPKSGAKSPVKSPGLNKSGEYYQEEERDDIYFEPVVTLPENYKLETGEENEEVKFSQRAKLYRFDVEGSQWKERGVGDIKVLYNPETKQYRIVMRREQVLKVCANHYITEHVNLQPNKGSERSWVWRAMDSSDGDPQNEQLAVRFKTEDAAREFKEVVDGAKKNLPGTSEQPSNSTEEQKETN